MGFLAIFSVVFQIKAQEKGGFSTFLKLLAAGTGPTYRKAEEDIDTDKEM